MMHDRILILIMDSMIPSQLKLYGGPCSAPNLEAWGRNNIICTNVLSPAAFTAPSLASIFTGLYTLNHNVKSNTGAGSGTFLYREIPGIWDVVKNYGYDIYYFGEFGIGLQISACNDRFDTVWVPQTDACNHDTYLTTVPQVLDKYEDMVSKSSKSISILHMWATHAPFGISDHQLTPLDFHSRYQDMIGWCDDNIFTRVLTDDTTTFLVSDHGDEFIYDGIHLCHHAESAHQCVVTPILIVSGEAAIIDSLVSTVDILPTIIDTVGWECNFDMDGHTLLDPLQDRYAHCWGNGFQIIRHNSHKLIYNSKHHPKRNNLQEFELYDLSEDPNELNNIFSPEHPEFINIVAWYYAHIFTQRYPCVWKGMVMDGTWSDMTFNRTMWDRMLNLRDKLYTMDCGHPIYESIPGGPREDMEERLRKLGYIE